MKKPIARAVLLAAIAAALPLLGATLQLVPGGGNLQGPAGGVVGWDFQLTNDDPDNYLFVNFTEFTDGTTVPGAPFMNCSGDCYSDLLGPAGLVLAPSGGTGDSAGGLYSLGAGIGSFLIDSTAPLGTLADGSIVVYFTLYSDADLSASVGTGYALALASVTVNQEAPAAVPEPATAGLASTAGLMLLAALRRRRT